MLDYAILHQRDRRDVHFAYCMRGADCWSDHRILWSKMNIWIAWKKKMARDKPLWKLNISQLISSKEELHQKI